jgi:hypothetical protein
MLDRHPRALLGLLQQIVLNAIGEDLRDLDLCRPELRVIFDCSPKGGKRHLPVVQRQVDQPKLKIGLARKRGVLRGALKLQDGASVIPRLHEALATLQRTGATRLVGAGRRKNERCRYGTGATSVRREHADCRSCTLIAMLRHGRRA